MGAKTVNGPSPCSVSTRPAACTAATSVVWMGELLAFSIMFMSAIISAPPTIGLSGEWAAAKAEPALRIRAAAVVFSKFVVMKNLSCGVGNAPVSGGSCEEPRSGFAGVSTRMTLM